MDVGTAEVADTDESRNQNEPSTSTASAPITAPAKNATRVTSKTVILGDRIRLMDVDDRLYWLFCTTTLHGRVGIEMTREEQRLLRILSSNDDLGVADRVFDSYLGELTNTIVHIPTTKTFLSPTLRVTLVKKVIESVKNKKEPLALALQVIQKGYLGFPPILQLRTLLFRELEVQMPNAISEEDKKAIQMANLPPPQIIKTKRKLAPFRPVTSTSSPKQPRTRSPSTSTVDPQPAVESTADSEQQPSTSGENVEKTNSQGGDNEREITITLPTEPKTAEKAASIDVYSAISDEIYDLFAEVVFGGKKVEDIEDEETRSLIAASLNKGLVAEFWEAPREFCGAGWRLLHNATKKIVPRKSEVPEIWHKCCGDMCAATNAKILAYLTTLFVGMSMFNIPPELRNREVGPGSRSRPVAAVGESPAGPGLDQPTTLPIPPAVLATKKVVIDIRNPISDNVYNLLAEVIAGQRELESIEDVSLRNGIEERSKGELIAEFWDKARDYCTAGWRLLDRKSGKIIPREGEVSEIWRNCYAKMGSTHSQGDILTYLDNMFVGISNKNMLREAVKHEILRGPKVQFPSHPKVLGSKPMQYVQIDIVDMDETLYGERYFVQALFVTDLYSGYVFGRALAETQDRTTTPIVRNLMDVFTTFGPPEAYRTSSLTLPTLICEVMFDIENMFKVGIKNVGFAADTTAALVRSIYRRAKLERGSSDRWVEALPYAIIEHNQKPNRQFQMKLSSFEVMFGRRPWRNDAVPPWIDAGEVADEKARYERGCKKSKVDEDTAASGAENKSPAKKKKRKSGANEKSLNVKAEPVDENTTVTEESAAEKKKRSTGTILNRDEIQSLTKAKYMAEFDENGKLLSPGTGFLFEVGDKVFVRNTLVDWRYTRTKKDGIPRYYRGCIVEVDETNVEYLYRVVYWQDDQKTVDEMDAAAWPAPGDGYDCIESWFSPWDVSASSPYLAKLRAVVPTKPAEESALDRCECGVSTCIAFRNEKCPHKLSFKCCSKRADTCSFHQMPQLDATSRSHLDFVREKCKHQKLNFDKSDPLGGNLSLVLFNRMKSRAAALPKTPPRNGTQKGNTENNGGEADQNAAPTTPATTPKVASVLKPTIAPPVFKKAVKTEPTYEGDHTSGSYASAEKPKLNLTLPQKPTPSTSQLTESTPPKPKYRINSVSGRKFIVAPSTSQSARTQPISAVRFVAAGSNNRVGPETTKSQFSQLNRAAVSKMEQTPSHPVIGKLRFTVSNSSRNGDTKYEEDKKPPVKRFVTLPKNPQTGLSQPPRTMASQGPGMQPPHRTLESLQSRVIADRKTSPGIIIKKETAPNTGKTDEQVNGEKES